MQRIDENTYIDDTLVTCAEYQLFIDDEARFRRFHQPDHWTSHYIPEEHIRFTSAFTGELVEASIQRDWISYRHPQGQAREPILGTRPSDAQAFCEWLTRRQDNEWHLRLPSQAEADDIPLHISVQEPHGYWVVGSDAKTQFTWIEPRSNPGDTRGIALFRALTMGIDIDSLLTRARALSGSLDIDRTLDLALTLGFGLYPDRARALNIEDDLVLDFIIARDLAFDRDSELARSRALGRDKARFHKLDLDHDNSRTRAIHIAFDRIHKITRALAIAQPRDRRLDRDRVRNLVRAFDVYIDFFTLQERIAGRSPALEGIRVVKERK